MGSLLAEFKTDRARIRGEKGKIVDGEGCG